MSLVPVGSLRPMAGDAGTIVGRNLERAGRPLSDIEKKRKIAETFEWYGRYYVESFRLPDVGVDELDRGFSYDGVASIEANCGPGKSGAILALPHLGTWEWAFWLARVIKVKVTAIVEPLQPPELFEWFVGLREIARHGIPQQPDAGKQIIDALGRGHLVACSATATCRALVYLSSSLARRRPFPVVRHDRAPHGVPLMPAAVPWRDHARHGWCRPPLKIERTKVCGWRHSSASPR